MPELPEVEMISSSLNSILEGRRINSAALLRERLAPGISASFFAESLKGAIINRVYRRGKHILFDLTDNKTLLVHLRMSGRFSLLDLDDADPKFTHAIFYLENQDRLVFDDQRHFGFMKIAATDNLSATVELAKLAPEPFSNEFSEQYLFQVCRSSKRTLKELLLDQTKVCGLGNIYACEAMFMAGLDPRKRAMKLSKTSVSRLHESIRKVLLTAIAHAGSRTVDPRNLEGSYFSRSGDADWYVYDREGQPCFGCNDGISRLKQGGRSTYFCSGCQKR